MPRNMARRETDSHGVRKGKRKGNKLLQSKMQRWQKEAEQWTSEATKSLVHEGSFYLIDDQTTTSIGKNGDSITEELQTLNDILLRSSLKKITHGEAKKKVLLQVRRKMHDAKMRSCDKPLTKLSPSFLGIRRADSTRTIPPTLKKWMKTKPNLAPILRATVSDQSNEFPTGGLIKISKKKKTLTGPLVSNEEGVPHWKRYDWGGGLSASEFALPKQSNATRLKIPELSVEMKHRLHNMIQNNLGEGLWNDRVGSQLARPLNSTVFCSIELQQQQHGTGVQYSEKGMNYFGGAGIGGYAEHQIEMPPSRSSTVASIMTDAEVGNGSRGSSRGSIGSSMGSSVGIPSRVGTPGTPGTPIIPGTPGKSCKWSREHIGTPPLRNRRAQTTAGGLRGDVGIRSKTPVLRGIGNNNNISRKKDHSNADLWSNFQPMAPDTAFSLSIVPLTSAQMNYRSKIQKLEDDIDSGNRERPNTVPTHLPSGSRKKLHQGYEQKQLENKRKQRRVHTPQTPPGSAGTSGRNIYGSTMPATDDSMNRNGMLQSRESINSRYSIVSMDSSIQSINESIASNESNIPSNTTSSNSSSVFSIPTTVSTERRPIYSSGSMPSTFRGGFQYRRPLPTPPLLNQQHEAVQLPRGLSRQVVAFSYKRFPYGEVAHWAARTLQRCIRSWQLHKHNQLTKVQSLVRQWKAKKFTNDRRNTYEAALIVLQRTARVFLAKLKVLWIKHALKAKAARKIQALHRGNIGRIEAEKWRIFVMNRSANHIQRHWHAACGRSRAKARYLWKHTQIKSATLIESCWRGYHYGTLRVYRIKMWSAMELQRICRGWLGRVKAVRKLFYRAANDIQRVLYHGRMGRVKAKNIFNERVDYEVKRREKENRKIESSVLSAVSIIKGMLDINGDTLPGVDQRERRVTRNKEIKRAKKMLKNIQKLTINKRKKRTANDDPRTKNIKKSLQFSLRYNIEKIFKSYDLTGKSGCIPIESLKDLLKDLCVPLTNKEMTKVTNILKSSDRLQSDGIHDSAGYKMNRIAATKDIEVVRFEAFWELYITSLKQDSNSVTGNAVSEGELSHNAVSRLRTKLKVTRMMKHLIGKELTVTAKRWLMEEARELATIKARESFRIPIKQRPAFCCDQCLRPFVFDYEVDRHQKATDYNCKYFDVYDKLRMSAFNMEKKRLEEANVIILAKQREMKQFEKFRRPGLEDDEGEEKM